MNEVVTALRALSTRRPLFWSEADFQFALAWELKTRFATAEIRLERPFEVEGRLLHLDLLAAHQGRRWGIELKYRTLGLSHEIDGERFRLRDQSAEDHGRYDFLKDVERLEHLIEADHIDAGVAILLTDCRRFWRPSGHEAPNDAAFRVHEGCELTGSLAWAPTAGPGSTKGREHPIVLRGSYRALWEDYSDLGDVPGGHFRSLTLLVEPEGGLGAS